LKFGDYHNNDVDCIFIFKGCSSATFNTWIQGYEDDSTKESKLDFFFHDVEVVDIEINGVKLYKCSLVIPMMDCQITCSSVEVKTLLKSPEAGNNAFS
jgi:hypothetical protein